MNDSLGPVVGNRNLHISTNIMVCMILYCTYPDTFHNIETYATLRSRSVKPHTDDLLGKHT